MYVIHHDSVSSTGHTALVGFDRVHIAQEGPQINPYFKVCNLAKPLLTNNTTIRADSLIFIHVYIQSVVRVWSEKCCVLTLIPCSVSYMSSELTLQAFIWATSSNVHLGYLIKRSPGLPHQTFTWATSANVHLGYQIKRSPGLPHQTFPWATSANVHLGYLSKRSPGLPQQTFTWATSANVHLDYLIKRSPGLPQQTFTWATSANVHLGYLIASGMIRTVSSLRARGSDQANQR